MASLPDWYVPAVTVLAIGTMWLLVRIARGAPVRRGRVEAFARRHGLTVTATNGEQVIKYLTTTRRWRLAGVVIAAAGSIAHTLTRSEVGISFLALFIGWFLGALVAEVRITHLGYGPRRGASLVRRDAGRYLSRMHRVLVPAAAGLCLAAGGATAAAVISGQPVGYGGTVLALPAGLVVAVLVQLVQRRALRRPQPLAAPDVLAADDAIRSRSLHVLASAGAVLVTFCALIQVEALLYPSGGGSDGWVSPLSLAYLAVSLLGWTAAGSRWQVPQPADPPANPVAAAGGG